MEEDNVEGVLFVQQLRTEEQTAALPFGLKDGHQRNSHPKQLYFRVF
jgi:hypothetical protein